MDMLSDDTIYWFYAWTAVGQDAVVLNYIFVGSQVRSHILPSKAKQDYNYNILLLHIYETLTLSNIPYKH